MFRISEFIGRIDVVKVLVFHRFWAFGKSQMEDSRLENERR